MKKLVLTITLLISSLFILPAAATADTLHTNYMVFSAQQPDNLSTIYLYELSRDEKDRLYCYYKDQQGEMQQTHVLKIRDREHTYQITVEGTTYITTLDPEALKSTQPK